MYVLLHNLLLTAVVDTVVVVVVVAVVVVTVVAGSVGFLKFAELVVAAAVVSI